MPQALDLATAVKRQPDTKPRPARNPEPATRFDDVLDRQSKSTSKSDSTPKTAETKSARKADPASDQSKVDEAPEETSDVAEDPSETETPVAEIETDEQQPTANNDADDSSDQSDDETTDQATKDQAEAGVANSGMIATNVASPVNADVSVEDDVEQPDSTGAVAATSNQPASVKPINAGQKPVSAQDVESTDADGEAHPDASVTQAVVTSATGDGSTDDQDSDEPASSPQFAAVKADPSDAAAEPADLDSIAPVPHASAAKPTAAPVAVVAPTHVAHEEQFLDKNLDRIVAGMKSDMTPNGATMKIRLDPPNLGQLQIDVTIDDGVLTASFQTSNDEATRLLSHSMQQLKSTLESAGINVDRIQVKQTTAADASSQSRSDDQQQERHPEDQSSRQEQQRREMLQKMWAKLALGDVPLDMVA